MEMDGKLCGIENLPTESGTNPNRKLKHSRRNHRCIHATWNEFSRYSENSTIHGVRYLGQRKLHWSERMWWINTIVIAVALCALCMYEIYPKATSTVITFDDEFTQASEIPFPIVTLCDPIKVSPSMLNYSDIHKRIVDSNYTTDLPFEVIQQMFAVGPHCRENAMFEYVKRNNISIDRQFVQLYLKHITEDIFTLGQCKLFSAKWVDCRKLFTQTTSSTGNCYIINHLSSAQTYKDNVLADDFPLLKPFFIEETNTSYPIYVKNAVANFLQIFIRLPHRDIDSLCNTPHDKNHLVLSIRSAEEQLTRNVFRIPLDGLLGRDVKISVRPNKLTTNQYLIDRTSKDERKCVDGVKENDLTFFRRYSQQNCFFEKLVNDFVAQRGCANFLFPRRNETRVCGEFEEYNSFTVGEMFANAASSTQQCLPACNSLTYDSTMTISDFVRSMNETDSLVRIAVGFDNQQYLFMKRSELYGKINFYAGCAGVISLFMGVSFLSVAEIFYYFTLRLFLNRRTRPKTDEIKRISISNTI